MGVTGLHRQFLRRRYPHISRVLTKPFNGWSHSTAPCDNLYIDMNHIIHSCKHANMASGMPLSKPEMFARMEAYISVLVDIAAPTTFIFIAIDGVAPLAKMQRQRAQRFLSAHVRGVTEEIEIDVRREMATQAGGSLPCTVGGDTFDSNAISPGTEFMMMVAQKIRHMIKCKISTDPRFACLKVLISDASEPSEGEHKIMRMIRHMRGLPGYNPNTRHIIYGQDADLILLSLLCHEPHMRILREGQASTADDLTLTTGVATEPASQDSTREGLGNAYSMRSSSSATAAAMAAATAEDCVRVFEEVDIGLLLECLNWEFADLIGEPGAVDSDDDCNGIPATEPAQGKSMEAATSVASTHVPQQPSRPSIACETDLDSCQSGSVSVFEDMSNQSLASSSAATTSVARSAAYSAAASAATTCKQFTDNTSMSLKLQQPDGIGPDNSSGYSKHISSGGRGPRGCCTSLVGGHIAISRCWWPVWKGTAILATAHSGVPNSSHMRRLEPSNGCNTGTAPNICGTGASHNQRAAMMGMGAALLTNTPVQRIFSSTSPSNTAPSTARASSTSTSGGAAAVSDAAAGSASRATCKSASSVTKSRFNLHRVVEDVVVLTFLVGNDYLPLVPSLDIYDQPSGLELLFVAYKQLLPVLGGHIAQGVGHIHEERLCQLLAFVAKDEAAAFQRRALYRRRRREQHTHNERDVMLEGDEDLPDTFSAHGSISVGELPPDIDLDQVSSGISPELGALLGLSGTRPLDFHTATHAEFWAAFARTVSKRAQVHVMSADPWATDLCQMNFPGFRKRYYAQCFPELCSTGMDVDEVAAIVSAAYLQGISWVYRYYSCGAATLNLHDASSTTSARAVTDAVGCGTISDADSAPEGASWTWAYPYHYAPLVQDLANPRHALAARKLPLQHQLRAALASSPLALPRLLLEPSSCPLSAWAPRCGPCRPLVQLMSILPPRSAAQLLPEFVAELLVAAQHTDPPDLPPAPAPVCHSSQGCSSHRAEAHVSSRAGHTQLHDGIGSASLKSNTDAVVAAEDLLSALQAYELMVEEEAFGAARAAVDRRATTVATKPARAAAKAVDGGDVYWATGDERGATAGSDCDCEEEKNVNAVVEDAGAGMTCLDEYDEPLAAGTDGGRYTLSDFAQRISALFPSNVASLVDMSGKRFLHQGVVRLPPVKPPALALVLQDCLRAGAGLTEQELARNAFCPADLLMAHSVHQAALAACGPGASTDTLAWHVLLTPFTATATTVSMPAAIATNTAAAAESGVLAAALSSAVEPSPRTSKATPSSSTRGAGPPAPTMLGPLGMMLARRAPPSLLPLRTPAPPQLNTSSTATPGSGCPTRSTAQSAETAQASVAVLQLDVAALPVAPCSAYQLPDAEPPQLRINRREWSTMRRSLGPSYRDSHRVLGLPLHRGTSAYKDSAARNYNGSYGHRQEAHGTAPIRNASKKTPKQRSTAVQQHGGPSEGGRPGNGKPRHRPASALSTESVPGSMSSGLGLGPGAGAPWHSSQPSTVYNDLDIHVEASSYRSTRSSMRSSVNQHPPSSKGTSCITQQHVRELQPPAHHTFRAVSEQQHRYYSGGASRAQPHPGGLNRQPSGTVTQHGQLLDQQHGHTIRQQYDQHGRPMQHRQQYHAQQQEQPQEDSQQFGTYIQQVPCK